MTKNETFAAVLRARQSGEELFARFPEGRLAHGYPAAHEAIEWASAKKGELGFPEWVQFDPR